MKSTVLATASALVGLAAAQSDITCVSGAHVIVARASGEDPGFGILVVVKDDILGQIPNSDAVAVEYPATIDDPIYFQSQPDGVGNMTELVKAYGDACPDNKMVLLGYSQGAHVVGDVLLGNVNPLFDDSEVLADKYLAQISSAILMGDPTHVANQTEINVGNATNDGVFPRRNNDWVSKNLVGRVQSYCDANDTYCDNGNSSRVHAGYVQEYGDRAVEFVVQRFMGNSTNGNATPTTSGTPGPASPTETGAAMRLAGGRGSVIMAAVLAVGFAMAL